jgi:hypothetical protein
MMRPDPRVPASMLPTTSQLERITGRRGVPSDSPDLCCELACRLKSVLRIPTTPMMGGVDAGHAHLRDG